MLGLLVAGLVLSYCHAFAGVELDPISHRLATADPTMGEKLFLQCRACHLDCLDFLHIRLQDHDVIVFMHPRYRYATPVILIVGV